MPSTDKGDTFAKLNDSNAKICEFPPGLPRPDDIRNWGVSVEAALTHHGLTEVASGSIPDGTFDKIWSDRALVPLPAPPDGASWGDMMKYRQHLDEIEKRKAHNETIMAKRRTYWRDKTNVLFQLLTDSMVRTAPALRDTLRAKYARGDGFYDGVGAKAYIESWCRVMATIAPGL